MEKVAQLKISEVKDSSGISINSNAEIPIDLSTVQAMLRDAEEKVKNAEKRVKNIEENAEERV